MHLGTWSHETSVPNGEWLRPGRKKGQYNTGAFKSAIPMGSYCLIPLDLLGKFTTVYSGTVTKYTGSVGEHLSPDSRSSWVKDGPVDIYSPTILGWAWMNAEPIFNCVVPLFIAMFHSRKWVKWWRSETKVLSDCLCMRLVKVCNSCNWLLQKALEQCCPVTLSARIEKVSVCTAQYGSHKLHMTVDS